jgi:hypothetical protein
MYVAGNVSAKAMCHKRKKCWCVKAQYDTDMGTTSIESFSLGILWGKAENSSKDKHLGRGNQDNVYNILEITMSP